MIDFCTVGAGPAGISAALYALRAGFSVLIIDGGGGALRKAESIENYYGFALPISGEELAERGIEQAKRLGAELLRGEVVSLAPEEDGGFSLGISLPSGEAKKISARSVLLAAGSPRKAPALPGLTELEGHGVSYCAVCDAFFYRKKAVAVLGSGEYARAEAMELLPLVSSVTLLTNGEEPTADFPREIIINTKPIARLKGEKKLECVSLADGEEIPLDGLFVAYGTAGSGDLARKIGAETKGASIVTDYGGGTNVPGLFAAGDCTGGTLQIAKAVNDGMNAGLSAIKYLRGK
jgi:thioredoxin reductase (NADPH)